MLHSLRPWSLAGLLVALGCAHSATLSSDATRNTDVLAHAVLHTIWAAPLASTYEVEVGGTRAGTALLDAAACLSGLTRVASELRATSTPEGAVSVVLIKADPPSWAPHEHSLGAERATVPVSYSVPGGDPVQCEVLVVASSAGTGWSIGTHSDTPCWPKPGRSKQSTPGPECSSK
jgi:hypothetical protein